MDQPLFFDGFGDLVRVLVLAPLLYCAVIVFIRMAGKRSTSQMNNFDWIVTVALGSLMASPILLKDVTLLETLLAIACLLGLQWALTKAVFHSDALARLVKPEPTLLVSNGAFLESALRRERVTREEVIASIRETGLASVADVRWVILETDATMSVIADTDPDLPATAIDAVAGSAPSRQTG